MRRLLLIHAEIAARLQRDRLLLVLLGFGLSLFDADAIATYPQHVDWPTIAALAGLLLLTTGLEESGFLHHVAYQVITRMRSERHLALLQPGLARDCLGGERRRLRLPDWISGQSDRTASAGRPTCLAELPRRSLPFVGVVGLLGYLWLFVR
jgi:hypothetical protein